jgi:hypothetical protein
MRRLALVLLLASSPAFAQEAAQAPNGEGEYGGVQPGQPKKPEPGKKAKKPPPKGTLSWIGFEAKDGGSEIFLQSVAPFEVTQHVDGGVLVVNLSGVSKLAANVWRPIDTRFFDTPVARVVAKKKGKGIEVRVTFKNAKDAAQASVRTATEADGRYYAYLGFSGSGTPVEAPTATPAPATPAPSE